MIREKQCASFINRGRGLGAEGDECPLEAGKGKKTDSLLEVPERKAVLRH